MHEILEFILALGVKKLYYSIGEVSDITHLKPYVLRYWETEFTNLSPSKNQAGNRVYTERDINRILEIKRLLYQEKFTIEGARQYFKNNPDSHRSITKGSTGSVSSGEIRERDIARKALEDVQESVNDLLAMIRRER
ncbi:MerR family transcriptional regulator [Candidatus Neomarinimicrobiota bacterium]